MAESRDTGGSFSPPCPKCGHDRARTVNSRKHEDGSVRRRRECVNCNHRVTTYETLIDPNNHDYGLTTALKKRLMSLDSTVSQLVKDLLK